jgi:hypothetical protein
MFNSDSAPLESLDPLDTIEPHERVALEALWASAEHWLDNWADPATANIYGSACPLCRLYNLDPTDIQGCRGCPIFADTAQSDCWGTPWRGVQIASIDLDADNPGTVEYFRDAAQRMYAYLVELALRESERLLARSVPAGGVLAGGVPARSLLARSVLG